jgi:hypothetical protein
MLNDVRILFRKLIIVFLRVMEKAINCDINMRLNI